MAFTLYPNPPVRALSVGAGATVFTQFVSQSAPVAEFDPPYQQVMFVRVAMLSGSSPPKLSLAVGTGTAVEPSTDPQGVFSGPGDVGYVGDVSLKTLGANVFEVMVGFVAINAELPWRLGILNTDAVSRPFTWVVADSQADTMQPWVKPGTAQYRVADTFSAWPWPHSIEIDPGRQTAYVSSLDSDLLGVIDLPSSTVTDMPLGHFAETVAVDPRTHTVYVSRSHGGMISAIDPASQRRTNIDVPSPAVSGLAVNPEARVLYVAGRPADFSVGPCSVHAIDIGGHTVTQTISVGQNSFLRDLAVDPTTHAVFATDEVVNTLWWVDPDAGTAEPIDLDAPGFGIAVDPASHAVYVSCPTENTLSIFEPHSRAMTTLHVGPNPTGVAIDPGVHTVYVANAHSTTVSAIDTRTGIATSISLPENPHRLAVDRTTHTLVAGHTSTASVSMIKQLAPP